MHTKKNITHNLCGLRTSYRETQKTDDVLGKIHENGIKQYGRETIASAASVNDLACLFKSATKVSLPQTEHWVDTRRLYYFSSKTYADTEDL